MEKFTKLRKSSTLAVASNYSIMSNFIIRSIVVFSSICITLLMFFVSNVFHFWDHYYICIFLIVFCFVICFVISLLPRRFYLEQILTPVYLFGAYMLFFLVTISDIQTAYLLDNFVIILVFACMLLVSKSYINVTLSVSLLFYHLINIQLMADNMFLFYFLLIFLFIAFYMCNVYTLRILLLLKGNLEKLNGLILGIILSIYYLLLQVNNILPLLSFEHVYWQWNIEVGLLLIILSIPVFYKSILCNKYLVENKVKLFMLTMLCLLTISTNLLILLSVLVTVICFFYNFNTGVIVGLLALLSSLIYTFISDDVIYVFKGSVLLIAGIILLLLYVLLKLKKQECV